mmetsp:Transcript_30771/g.57667  ORF Transcript_30771/g.57667 Transcript_30771/m.57667 type:complete len:398 (+) Transcript_30771:115-1308(+)
MAARSLVALCVFLEVGPASTLSALRKNEAMPDPSAIAAPFFPFVGRVAVLTPKDKIASSLDKAMAYLPNSSDVLGNMSAEDIFGAGGNSSESSASTKVPPNSTAGTSDPDKVVGANETAVIEGADSPLLAAASGEVKAQVTEAMEKANAQGAAAVEEAVKDAKDKWVSEAQVLEMEDEAKMDKAVKEDLSKVDKKIQAVQTVQIDALQTMAQDVKAAMSSITATALEAAVDTTRSEVKSYEHQVLAPALDAIHQKEGSVEYHREKAMKSLQVAQKAADQLKAMASVAAGLKVNITDSPEDIARALRKKVQETRAKVKASKDSAESTLKLAEEASRQATSALIEANATEAEAQTLLERALAQAGKIEELEQRTASAKKQAEMTELLRKAGLAGGDDAR